MVDYPLAIYFSSYFEISHFSLKNTILTQGRDYLIPISSQIIFEHEKADMDISFYFLVHTRNRIPAYFS